jgi:ATP-dependent DNA ligase
VSGRRVLSLPYLEKHGLKGCMEPDREKGVTGGMHRNRPLHFFIFDVLVRKGKDVIGEPLIKRRELIEEHALPKLAHLH